MDYVIAGLGFGAVLAIIGFLLRELAMSRPSSIPRWLAGLGAALMVSSLVIWVVTAASFFSGLDDDSALRIVAGCAIAATSASIIVVGIVARSHRPQPVIAAAAVEAHTAPATMPLEVKATDEEAVAEESRPLDLGPAVQKDEEEPAKDWAEIWRQTWGSDAIAAPEPEPAESAPQSEMESPNQSVLESWGEDTETPLAPAATGGPSPAEAAAETDADSAAGELEEPEALAEDEPLDLQDRDEPGDALHAPEALNGNDPEADPVEADVEAGLAGTPTRDEH